VEGQEPIDPEPKPKGQPPALHAAE
jgi:hypothetical protein